VIFTLIYSFLYVILGCAPAPGTYDPKSPGPKTIKGTKFNKAERFKEPSVPQVN
jgi:hypothetical protein